MSPDPNDLGKSWRHQSYEVGLALPTGKCAPMDIQGYVNDSRTLYVSGQSTDYNFRPALARLFASNVCGVSFSGRFL